MKKYRIICATIGTSAIALGACRDDLTKPPANSAQRNAASVAVKRTTHPPRSDEALLHEMEKQAPGFGGYFVDEVGGVHVWLTASSSSEKARSAVSARVRDKGIATGRRDESAITIERGGYTFTQLVEWRDLIFDERQAGRLLQIVGLDADEAANRVLVEQRSGQ